MSQFSFIQNQVLVPVLWLSGMITSWQQAECCVKLCTSVTILIWERGTWVCWEIELYVGITWYIADAFLMSSVILITELCPCPWGEPHAWLQVLYHARGTTLFLSTQHACQTPARQPDPPRGVSKMWSPTPPPSFQTPWECSLTFQILGPHADCVIWCTGWSHSAFLTSSIDSRTQ